MIGTRRVVWFARLLLLGSLVVSGLTCDAFQPPTGGLPVAVSVLGDSIVSLKQTVRFTATATTSAGSAPGAAFRWHSTVPAVAKVDSTGAVIGQGRGRAWIIAQLLTPDFPSGGPEDSVEVWVRFASVGLNRDTATVTAIGDTLLLQARGRDALGVDAGVAGATWRSSNDSVATVSVDGAVVARRPGTASITARADSLSVTMQVTVRQVAARITFTALRNDSLVFDALQVDSTIAVRVTDRRGVVVAGPQVTWTSSRPTVVLAVDAAAGRFRSLLADTATLTARVDTAGAKVRANVVQVITQVRLTPDTVSTDAVSDTLQLGLALLDRNGRTVGGRTPTWVSRDTTVAVLRTTDAAGGRVVSRADGTTRIVTSYGSVADSTLVRVSQLPRQVRVTPATMTFIALADTATLAAQPADRLGSVISGRVASWSSSDTTVARVSATGNVRAVGEGRVQILATVDTIVGRATVFIGIPASVSAPDQTVVLDAIGDTVTLPTAVVLSARLDTIPGLSLTWLSNDATVVQALSGGRVVTRANGTTYVVASYGTFRDSLVVRVAQAVASVTVEPSTVTLRALGDTTRFTATPKDRRNTAVAERAIRWSSANDSIVTIDTASGLARAVRGGSTTVSASVGGVSGSAQVSVQQSIVAIDVRADTATLLAAGQTRPFTVSATDSRGNAMPADLSGAQWTSTNTAFLTVAPATGGTTTATAVAYGVAYVRAVGLGYWDSSRVIVTPRYGGVAVSPATATLTSIDDTVRLAGTATDTVSGTIASPLLIWTSSDTTVATVAQTGRVTARRDGTAVVTVTGGTLQASATVTVRQAVFGLRQRAPWPPTNEVRALGDTFRIFVEAFDRRNYAIPRVADSVRWSIDPTNTGYVQVFRIDSVTGRLTAIGFPTWHTCTTCYQYGINYYGVVAGQAQQYYASYYPRVYTAELAPDTVRQTRLRSDTLHALLRDRLGNPSVRLFTLIPPFVTSTDTSVATVQVLDSAGGNPYRYIVVTGRNAGVARIILTATAHADTGATRKLQDTTVVVVSPVVASVTASVDSTLLALGDRVTLLATTRDSAGAAFTGQAVTWTSLDTLVARVDAAGVVVPDAIGRARIVAQAGALADTVVVIVQRMDLVFVDSAYAGTVSTGSSSQPFRTITEGVTNAAPGGVVRVRRGTYPEAVVISRRLRLWGDGASAVRIRPVTGSSTPADGIKVTVADTVEIRGVTVSGATLHGINATGDLSAGPQLAVRDVAIRNSALAGLSALRPSALAVTGVTIEGSGQDGVRLTDANASTAQFSDVTITSNSGFGILLQRSRADLARVTIGATSVRSGDTRYSYSGSAVVLDSSVARISGLTARTDNADTAYAVVVDRGSRLTALSGSSINTKYQVNVLNGSGADSLLDNVFSTSRWVSPASSIVSVHRDQNALLVRGNTFTTPNVSLFVSQGRLPVLLERNTFNGSGSMLQLVLSGDATARNNRFLQPPTGGGGTLVNVWAPSPDTAHAVMTVVGNEFRSTGAGALNFFVSSIQLRADSNDFVYAGGSNSGPVGLFAWSDVPMQVGYNRFTGLWGYGVNTQGQSPKTLRRNTVDSAAIAFLVEGYSATIDSNVVRRGASGIVIQSGWTCMAATCVVTQNAFSNLSGYGVRAASSANRVDARGNWWGAASGPLDEDASGAGFNPAGTGVSVRDGASLAVTYSPWLEVEPEVGSPLVSTGTVSAVTIVSPTSAQTLTSLGDTLRFRAQVRDGSGALISGAALAWRSSAPAVALVDAATGLVTAVANGAARIAVTAGGRSDSLGVTVRQAVAAVDLRPDTATLVGLNLTKSFVVVVRDARGSAIDTSLIPVTWSASDAAVVTVGGASKSGATITGAGFGVAYVRALSGSVGDSSRLVVTPRYGSVVLTQHAASLTAVGQTLQLGASVTDTVGGVVASPLLTWTSTDTTRVRVDQTGLVTARGNGTAKVAVGGGLRADTATITVSQAAVALRITPDSRRTLAIDALNDTLQMVGEVRDAQGSAIPGLTVSWQVADAAVATVGASGQLVSRAAGTTSLIARYVTTPTLADTIAVVVSQRVTQVTVTPANKAFAAWTDTLTFQAAARDRKGTLVSGRSVSWSSADAEVAAVDPLTGRVTTGRRNGSTQVRATVDGVVGTANVAVSQTMAAADVQPDTAMVLALNDSSRVFSVVVRDARGETVAPSAYTVAWQVQDVSVAALVGTPFATAQVRSVAFGTTYIRAIATSRTGTAVSVRDSSRIVVSRVYGTVALARDTATLTAVYDSVGLSATVTDTLGVSVGSPLLTWTSSDTAVATVSQVGMVRAQRDGLALVTVSGGTRQDTARITVLQTAIGIRQRAPYPPSSEMRALGDTFRIFVEAYDRNNYAVPRLANSVRWGIDPTNTQWLQTFRIDSVSGLLTAIGFPTWHNCTTCAAYSINYYAVVAGQTQQYWANYYPRVYTAELAPDTVRQTRLRPDTLRTFLRDRLGNPSVRLFTLISPFVVSTDTAVATVQVLDSVNTSYPNRYIVVTGRSAGTARIILTATAHADTGATRKLQDTTVVVVAPVVANLAVSPDSALLAVGDRLPLTVSARDSGSTLIAQPTITWSSADPAFATVDTAGVVTGVAVGTARITATAGPTSQTVKVVVQNLSVAYVDASYTGTSTGTATAPYKTIGEAVAAVDTGGVVRVRAGTYNETVVIPKRLRLWGDAAATTIIRANASDDGIRVETSDTVEIRRVSVVGPASGFNYDGINAAGDATVGVRLRISDVVVRNQIGRGMDAVRPVSLVVSNSEFRNNGQEGIHLLLASNKVQLTDVLMQGNAGNGVLLDQSVAELTRVTIGGTTQRSGDSRSWNGSALVALNASTVRVTGSSVLADNWSGTYAIVVEGGSAMPLLGTTSVATRHALWVGGGSGVDAILDSRFTTTSCYIPSWAWDYGWSYGTYVGGARPGQTSMLIRGNVYDAPGRNLLLNPQDRVVSLAIDSNSFRSGGRALTVGAQTYNHVVRLRGNQFVEAYPDGCFGSEPRVSIHGNQSDSVISVLNSFASVRAAALSLNSVGGVRLDSNIATTTGSPAYGVYVTTNEPVTARFNTFRGPWARAFQADWNGALLLRYNTVDSAQGAFDLAPSQVTMDSNVVRNGQFGVQFRNGGCDVLTCVVERNSFSQLTDFGVKATQVSAKVAAVNNWWGSVSGPRDSDPTGFEPANSGTGVRVFDGTSGVGRVTFRPWLSSAPVGIGAPTVFAAPMLVRARFDAVAGSGALPPQER